MNQFVAELLRPLLDRVKHRLHDAWQSNLVLANQVGQVRVVMSCVGDGAAEGCFDVAEDLVHLLGDDGLVLGSHGCRDLLEGSCDAVCQLLPWLGQGKAEFLEGPRDRV